MDDLPRPIVELVALLAEMPGVVAVVLGGSRATKSEDAASDWDIGVYYRGALDFSRLAEHGTVFPPGSWGRVMNGGAWLDWQGLKADVLLRDLDVAWHWTERAKEGAFECDALLGYLAGVPTYTLAAELALCRPLHGQIPPVAFPPGLAEAAPPTWRFCRSFSLNYARAHARRGNLAGAAGQAAKAMMEEAHALACERSLWACNEKRLLQSVGLSDLNALFSRIPEQPDGLCEWVELVAKRLEARS